MTKLRRVQFNDDSTLTKRRGTWPYIWSFTQQIAEQLLSFSISVILARLLTPYDFGLVAMVVVVSGFGQVFVDLGLGNALVHKESPTHEDFSTVFWTNLGLSLAFSFALFFAAPALARFYKQDSLVTLARVLAPNFALAGFVGVDAALLRRRLNFRALAVASVVSSVLAGIVGVVLAVLGLGATALAISAVCRTAIYAIALRGTTRFVPSMTFRLRSLYEFGRYGSGTVGADILNYWARNADNLLVGKLLGSTQLGIYNRGYSLMSLPKNLISRIVTAVLFPILSRKKGTVAELRDEFVNVCARVGFAAFPIMVGMACTADPLIRTLFGNSWLGVVWLLRWLAPLGLYQSIVALYGPIYLSCGRTDLDFKVSLLAESVLIASIFVGIAWGLPGLVAGLYISAIVNFWPTNMVPMRLIGLRLSILARALTPAFIASIIMAGAVLAVGCSASLATRFPLLLATQAVSGIVVYVTACHVLRVPALREVLRVVTKGKLLQ